MRRKQQSENNPPQQYLNIVQSAQYCGYAPRYFSKIIFVFKLPRYGPKKNRFKRTDLDLWMNQPYYFSNQNAPERNGFKKVKL